MDGSQTAILFPQRTMEATCSYSPGILHHKEQGCWTLWKSDLHFGGIVQTSTHTCGRNQTHEDHVWTEDIGMDNLCCVLCFYVKCYVVFWCTTLKGKYVLFGILYFRWVTWSYLWVRMVLLFHIAFIVVYWMYFSF